MATYIILNVVFTTIALLILTALKAFRPNRVMAATLGILLVLTALFDSAIITAGIVAYNPQTLLGIMVGAAPVEDFFYAVLTAVMIPSVWHLTKRRHTPK